MSIKNFWKLDDNVILLLWIFLIFGLLIFAMWPANPWKYCKDPEYKDDKYCVQLTNKEK